MFNFQLQQMIILFKELNVKKIDHEINCNVNMTSIQ